MAGRKKLDVSQIDTTSRVSSAIAQGTGKRGQQDTASAEEIAERKSGLRTQGRKGAKATRIHMAITPENHEYIEAVSKSMGMTMTEFINYCVQLHREANAEDYEQLKKITERMKSKGIG